MALIRNYVAGSHRVTIFLDEQPITVRTHQTTVGAVLREIGIEVAPVDLVYPPLGASVRPGATIHIRLALPVTVETDGDCIQHRTHSRTVGELLRELDIPLNSRDRVLLNGQATELSTALGNETLARTTRTVATRGSRGTPVATSPPPVRIAIQRAVPITIIDEGLPTTVLSTARSVGEALLEQKVPLYLGDQINPGPETPLTADLRVYIKRSKPVSILVDGREIRTRTLDSTVSDVLQEEGVTLRGKDYTDVSLDTEVTNDMTIRVTRVMEDWIVEAEPIAYQTVWKPDPNLELDQRRVDQPGAEGVKKRRIRITYADGVETARVQEEEWVEVPPTPRIIAYGTKIVLRDLQTPAGTIRYWRHLRVLATSYTAATSGKSPDHPAYGITRLGWQARQGVIAVDPTVIRLRTKMYVPGYGFGTAADTGGAIKGRRIDLCYDEQNLKLWYRWVDVYLLEPVPPPNEIPYILPDYPQERARGRS